MPSESSRKRKREKSSSSGKSSSGKNAPNSKPASRAASRKPASTSATVPASDQDEDFIPFLDDSDSEPGPSKGPVFEQQTRRRARDDRRRQDTDTMIFDYRDYASRQRERIAREQHQKIRQTPWVQGLDVRDCRDIAEVFHDEVRAFVEWISPKPHEDEIRGLVVERITQVIVDRFPDAEITPFGSYGTKLYLPHGDIDLVIQSKSMGYSDKHTVLQALSRTITYAGIASKVSIIAKAKVPIVKFITTGEYGRFQVDISINHVNGIHAGRIMNGFLHDMRANLALRSLVFVVKAFLNQRGMNEVYTGGLSSYSVICLVISFIQMHPKIRNQEIDPDTNVGVLVMEFFEFYGCYHNYEEVGISLREGGYYYSKRRRNWLNPAKPRSLSIEDPADPSNDISAGSWAYQKVRATFAGAYEMLTASIYLQAMNFKALQEGTMTPLRGGYHPEDWSVLSSIIAIKPEVVNHRQLVLEVYESQRLHQELGVAPRQTADHSQEVKVETIRFTRGSSEDVPEVQVQTTRKSLYEILGVVDGDVDHQGRDLPDAEEEPEGRYDLSPQLFRRNIKLPRNSAVTVFTTDEDESDDDLARIVAGRRTVASISAAPQSEKQVSNPRIKIDRKRAYWSSLGADPNTKVAAFPQD